MHFKAMPQCSIALRANAARGPDMGRARWPERKQAVSNQRNEANGDKVEIKWSGNHGNRNEREL